MFSSKVIRAHLLVVASLAVMSAQAANPYAGQEQRDIKALSSAEVERYLAGKGAGFAKAAELNHYPGPAHVLELADPLQLSTEQKRRSEALFDAMRRSATRYGKDLVEKERELDRQFAAGTITPEALRSALSAIGQLQAKIRGTHLQAHIDQRAILTKGQIEKYDELRGYRREAETGHGNHSHRHQ